MTLEERLYALPPEDAQEILSTIWDADTARLLGNKSWRKIFKTKWQKSKGNKRKVYYALFKNANRNALDATWEG